MVGTTAVAAALGAAAPVALEAADDGAEADAASAPRLKKQLAAVPRLKKQLAAATAEAKRLAQETERLRRSIASAREAALGREL